jgi:heterodisulfide reductase subunit A
MNTDRVAADRGIQSIENGRALVIGGGIAGIQAALDLANARVPVTLVEKSPTLGGRMAQLDKTFPTMDCAI